MTSKIQVKFYLQTDNIILILKFNAAVFVIWVIPLSCIVNNKIVTCTLVITVKLPNEKWQLALFQV